MNNSHITIIKEKRTDLSRKRIPLNQNGCTADFRMSVPFEQNLQRSLSRIGLGWSLISNIHPVKTAVWKDWLREQPDATIAAVDYGHNRKINRHLIERLATCEYITGYRNIFITGATGSGKTYLACAFGMEACKRYYSVKYVRVPDLLLDLQEARDEWASYEKNVRFLGFIDLDFL